MSSHDFKKIKSTFIPERNTTAHSFRHEKTGTELIWLENEDTNKSFGISFKTIPQDSSGVAHILEHSVLNGSQKYRVKEPFVELLKTSVQTYLNAWTFPDKTVYPVASQNEQDLLNLIDVYLDAVFFPLLDEKVFKQEGWHFELDENDTISIKGVVYNEMKGALSDPDRILFENIQSSLFPGTTYEKDSGGDPASIRELTYEEFKEFHKTYYHPSNAKIVLYGNLDIEKNLQVIDSYISQFSSSAAVPELKLTAKHTTTPAITKSYPVSSSQDNCMISKNWLLRDLTSQKDRIGFEVLSYYFHESEASPVRKALIESGLGEDLLPFSYDTDYVRPIFVLGAKGVALENKGKLLEMLDTTIAEQSQHIDTEALLSALNRLEFAYRENQTGTPRGLSMLGRMLTQWNYELDPLETLFFDSIFSELRQDMSKGYFESLIKNHLIENVLFSTVEMLPDPEFAQKKNEEEQNYLKTIQNTLTPEQILDLKKELEIFTEWQKSIDSPENLKAIPRLKASDIDKKTKTIPSEEIEIRSVKSFFHPLPTNNIVYLDLGFDIKGLEEKYIPYLSILSDMLLKLGTAKYSYDDLAVQLDTYIGDIDTKIYNTKRIDSDEIVSKFFISWRVLGRNFRAALDLVQEILLNTNFDQKERFKMLLLQEKTAMEIEIANSGHSYAALHARSTLHEIYRFGELTGGISQFYFIKEILQKIDENWDEVLNDLKFLYRRICTTGVLLNITCDEDLLSKSQADLTEFLNIFEQKTYGEEKLAIPDTIIKEAFIVPSTVNYVATAFLLSEYHYHGSIFAIDKIINRSYLWNKVRALGGAYGCFFRLDSRLGTIFFSSYRDPNIKNTLNTYDTTSEFLLETEFDGDEIDGAIVAGSGDLDDYMTPYEKGWIAFDRYITGVTDEYRQSRRDELLNTTINDFRELGIALKQRNKQCITVIGNSEKINETLQENKDIFTIQSI